MFQIGRMAGTATIAGVAMQHPNVYNSRLPHTETMKEDSAAYLQEIRVNLAKAVLDNDMGQCVVWVINLHKYIILYGMSFTKEEHVFMIKVLYNLFTTKNTDPVSFDKFAKVNKMHCYLNSCKMLTFSRSYFLFLKRNINPPV